MLGVPVLRRRGDCPRLHPAGRLVAADLAAPGNEGIQDRPELGLRDRTVDEQRLGRAADAGAPHLGVEDNLARHLGVGPGMDVGVAQSVQVRDHRDAAFRPDPFDQAAPAARHDDIYGVVHGQQDADRVPIGGRHALQRGRSARLREAGGPGGDGGDGGNGGDGGDETQVAAVALLVEAAVMDGDFDDDERRTIARLLGRQFGLEAAAVEDLIRAGEQAVERSNQLYAFTRVVKEGFDFEQRIGMIEMLWEVAYADGELHDFEASLVRRVAGLIHVADRDSAMARGRVLKRFGLNV